MSFIGSRLALLTASVDVDATSWRAAVLAAGGSVSDSQFQRISRLIRSLKGAGIWALLDRLWLHAAESSVQGLVDLKARTVATAVNSPAFAINRGFTGDGASSYLNLNFSLSTQAVAANVANIEFGGWVLTNVSGTMSLLSGANSANAGVRLRPRGTTSLIAGEPNATLTSGAISTGDSRGLTSTYRNGSAGAVCGFNKNGVLTETFTPTTFAGSLSNLNIYGLASNSNGTTAEFYTGQVAMLFIGAAGVHNATFYNLIHAYLLAVGAVSS